MNIKTQHLSRREFLSRRQSWDKVKARWLTHDVGDVDIRRFRAEQEYPEYPWFYRSTGKQYLSPRNPDWDTAHHLCCILPNYSDDIRIAYQIHAYSRTWGIDFTYGVLDAVFKKERFSTRLWHPNAIHVLPPVSNDDPYDLPPEEEWTVFIDRAAKTWKSIAEKWGVIRIPIWMDRNDPDLKTYFRVVKEAEETRERDLYERLKNKFES